MALMTVNLPLSYKTSLGQQVKRVHCHKVSILASKSNTDISEASFSVSCLLSFRNTISRYPCEPHNCFIGKMAALGVTKNGRSLKKWTPNEAKHPKGAYELPFIYMWPIQGPWPTCRHKPACPLFLWQIPGFGPTLKVATCFHPLPTLVRWGNRNEWGEKNKTSWGLKSQLSNNCCTRHPQKLSIPRATTKLHFCSLKNHCTPLNKDVGPQCSVGHGLAQRASQHLQ